MDLIETSINRLFVAKLCRQTDDRGFFFRSYCQSVLNEIGISLPIAQINQSMTKQVGSVRGMHFQFPPYAETKMIRCLAGEVFDVAIDLRHESPTFLTWHAEYLTPNNGKMMIIPEGFAHGFQVIRPESELLYFHTAPYSPANEGGIAFDDPRVDVKWPRVVTELSNRDRFHKPLSAEFKGLKV